MRIRWFRWANNERLLLGIWVNAGKGARDYASYRLLSLSKDGRESFIIAKPPSLNGQYSHPVVSQNQDEVVSVGVNGFVEEKIKKALTSKGIRDERVRVIGVRNF